jgi:AraC-like DNA-binding protein
MHDSPIRLHETLAAIREVRVLTAGRYSAAKGQDYPPHYHPALEVIVFQSGQIECAVAPAPLPASDVTDRWSTFEVGWNRLGAKASQLQILTRPGTVLVMPPRTVHADRALSAYSHYYLILALPEHARIPAQPIVFSDDLEGSLEHVMANLAREWNDQQVNREAMLEVLLWQMRLQSERLETNPLITHAEQTVRRAERLMADQIAEPQSISRMAQGLQISPSALRAYFANLRGYSPKQFQQQLRLNRALEMIRASSLSLDEIASLTGYDSASHLSRQVKTATGTTPGSFRLEL